MQTVSLSLRAKMVCSRVGLEGQRIGVSRDAAKHTKFSLLSLITIFITPTYFHVKMIMYVLLFNMVGIAQFFTVSFDEEKECPSAIFFTVIY